jgi:CDP-diacylglycerol--glycerol-3-phosphate 3-phosphatidyltransferase
LTLANRITLARIALIPLCIAFLLTGFYGLAAVFFLLLSFSDAIDGYIARKYHQVSELGKKLDPLADKILVLSVLIGLTGIGKADPVPVMLICAREFLVASFRGRKTFPASPVAKWKTAFQIISIVMLMLNLPFAGLALWVATILSLISGGAYLWQNRILELLRSS